MKKHKNLISIILASSILFLTAGWKNQPTLSLSNPKAVSFNSEGLDLSAKVYTPEDSKEYLHRDLISRGYVPVEVSINNNTAKSYAISGASVPLACATCCGRAWSVRRNGAIASRLTSDERMPSWPIAMPSVTVMVQNSRGVAPAALTPC